MNNNTPTKGQLNTPKDRDGMCIPVIMPGKYPRTGLVERNWRALLRSKSELVPQVIISPLGEVAAQFDKKTEEWRVMQQQILGDGYLAVWLSLSEDLAGLSSAYPLHQLVARRFCDITTDLVYLDENSELRLIKRPVVDHIDRCKTNNFYENLEWVLQSENVRRAQHGYRASGAVLIDKDSLKPEDRIHVT